MSAQAVWKFPVPWPPKSDTFTISMPGRAMLLSVQMQGGAPMIWALVEPDAPVTERRFRIAGTGHPIEEEIRYCLGTFQTPTEWGVLVFHVFEVAP